MPLGHTRPLGIPLESMGVTDWNLHRPKTCCKYKVLGYGSIAQIKRTQSVLREKRMGFTFILKEFNGFTPLFSLRNPKISRDWKNPHLVQMSLYPREPLTQAVSLCSDIFQDNSSPRTLPQPNLTFPGTTLSSAMR